MCPLLLQPDPPKERPSWWLLGLPRNVCAASDHEADLQLVVCSTHAVRIVLAAEGEKWGGEQDPSADQGLAGRAVC